VRGYGNRIADILQGSELLRQSKVDGTLAAGLRELTLVATCADWPSVCNGWPAGVGVGVFTEADARVLARALASVERLVRSLQAEICAVILVGTRSRAAERRNAQRAPFVETTKGLPPELVAYVAEKAAQEMVVDLIDQARDLGASKPAVCRPLKRTAWSSAGRGREVLSLCAPSPSIPVGFVLSLRGHAARGQAALPMAAPLVEAWCDHLSVIPRRSPRESASTEAPADASSRRPLRSGRRFGGGDGGA
jgi:hypothetical protein